MRTEINRRVKEAAEKITAEVVARVSNNLKMDVERNEYADRMEIRFSFKDDVHPSRQAELQGDDSQNRRD
jgi:hypothetical protein